MIRFLLGLMPPWGWLLMLVATLATAGGWHLRQVHVARQEGREEVQQRWNAAELMRQRDSATETARRLKAHQEVTDAEIIRRREAELSVHRLRTADERLRAQLAAIASGRDPATAGGGQAAAPGARVLADVLDQCRDRVRALVAEADATRAAGASCERSYDALRAVP